MISNITRQNNSQGRTNFKGSAEIVGTIPQVALKAASDIVDFASEAKFLGNDIHVVAKPKSKDSPFMNVDIYPFGKKPFWLSIFKPNPKLRVDVRSRVAGKFQGGTQMDAKGALTKKFHAFTEEFYAKYNSRPRNSVVTPREVLLDMTQSVPRESLDCVRNFHEEEISSLEKVSKF